MAQQQRRFVATPDYLSNRNDSMWSGVFLRDVCDAAHSLATLPWEQVDALPQYPNSTRYCLRRGVAVLIFEKRNRHGCRGMLCGRQHAQPQLHGCLCVKPLACFGFDYSVWFTFRCMFYVAHFLTCSLRLLCNLPVAVASPQTQNTHKFVQKSLQNHTKHAGSKQVCMRTGSATACAVCKAGGLAGALGPPGTSSVLLTTSSGTGRCYACQTNLSGWP